MAKICYVCDGTGRFETHGAFGESETHNCHKCGGLGYIPEKK